MDSRLYWIWLAQALGVGNESMGELIARFGDAAAIYTTPEAELLSSGIPLKTVRRLRDKSLAQARAILNRVAQAGDWVLTPADALYPVNLRRLPDCPAVLYCRGTMPDLDNRLAVALVGTRRATSDGWCGAHHLAAALAAGGAIVVSGGANGIDTAAHTGALDGDGLTIAVMACPVDVEYPKENVALRQRIVQMGGLLISEYPHGEEYRCVFALRNRLIAGLCHGVCLGETPVRSGARITARLARENGREVFAMPATLAGHRNDGAHREIQNGAALITGAADVLQEYASLFADSVNIAAAIELQKALEMQHTDMPSTAKAAKKAEKPKRTKPSPPPATKTPSAGCPDVASAAAKAVYEALTDTPQPVDDLAAATKLAIPALLGALTELEMFGCAANCAGQQYRKL